MNIITFNILRDKYFNNLVLLEHRIKLFYLNVEMWNIHLNHFLKFTQSKPGEYNRKNAYKWYKDFTYDTSRPSVFHEQQYVRLFRGDLINLNNCWTELKKIKIFYIENGFLTLEQKEIDIWNIKYNIIGSYFKNLQKNKIIHEEWTLKKIKSTVDNLLIIRNKLAHNISYGLTFIDYTNVIKKDYLPYLKGLKEILFIFNLSDIENDRPLMSEIKNIRILREGMIDLFIESHFSEI